MAQAFSASLEAGASEEMRAVNAARASRTKRVEKGDWGSGIDEVEGEGEDPWPSNRSTRIVIADRTTGD